MEKTPWCGIRLYRLLSIVVLSSLPKFWPKGLKSAQKTQIFPQNDIFALQVNMNHNPNLKHNPEVLVWFLVCLPLFFFTMRRFMLSYPAPFSHASLVLFSIIITLHWEERELVYILLVHLYAFLAYVACLPFSLLLGVGGELPRDFDCGIPWAFQLTFCSKVMKYLLSTATSWNSWKGKRYSQVSNMASGNADLVRYSLSTPSRTCPIPVIKIP